jgi:hypothetical protein
MKTHDWHVSSITALPPPHLYDVNVATDVGDRMCVCSACGLRVLASETCMPIDVPGLPSCRPSTYQTDDQLGVERLYLAAQVARKAVFLEHGSALALDVTQAFGLLATHAASRLESDASPIVWTAERRALLGLLLWFLEQSIVELERGCDWNWDDRDDPDFSTEESNSAISIDEQMHPESMLAGVRELRRLVTNTTICADVMES